MIEQPLVSIIVPIYKVESYLRSCVDSIINQTYKNLEIILVDDGSPDKCPSICDEYSQKDNRIKVIHKPNGGLSDARNAGIEIATGDYLCFIDSDDMVDGKMIHTLMQSILENSSIKISACQSLSFYDNDIFDTNQEEKQTEIINYQEFFTKKFWMTAWGKVYLKELFSNIQFPVGRIHEDEFTTYKICYDAKKIAYSESQLYFYRQREGSIMNSMTIKRLTDIHDALKEQTDFFQLHNENQLYYRFLINYVTAYTNRKKYKKTLEQSQIILSLWKSNIKNYSLKTFSFKQKLNFFLYFRFPHIRNFMSKCLKLFKHIKISSMK